VPVYILSAVDAYQKGTDTGKTSGSMKCFRDEVVDEVRSYEDVLVGFFKIIIFYGSAKEQWIRQQ